MKKKQKLLVIPKTTGITVSTTTVLPIPISESMKNPEYIKIFKYSYPTKRDFMKRLRVIDPVSNEMKSEAYFGNYESMINWIKTMHPEISQEFSLRNDILSRIQKGNNYKSKYNTSLQDILKIDILKFDEKLMKNCMKEVSIKHKMKKQIQEIQEMKEAIKEEIKEEVIDDQLLQSYINPIAKF